MVELALQKEENLGGNHKYVPEGGTKKKFLVRSALSETVEVYETAFITF